MSNIIIKYKKGDEFTGNELDELGHKFPVSDEDVSHLLNDVTVTIKIKDN